MASIGAGKGGESMYDQRLFNQEKGGLYQAENTLSASYQPRKDTDGDTYGGADEQLDKNTKTDRFKPKVKNSNRSVDKFGRGGIMRAAGGFLRDGYDGFFSISCVGFESGHEGLFYQVIYGTTCICSAPCFNSTVMVFI
ncbi:hypothetical protein RCOM_1050350 [Ricinus communis]|uniref:Uncharacterized protein n=1 Tax=Ricinus communis TaxID=3988 RepID=B9RKJ8_RICCO|nr:hypothetical protein RCOM_1050350 [Ricinus communis]